MIETACGEVSYGEHYNETIWKNAVNRR